MKLTLEEKIQIYNEWKIEHKSLRFLAIKYHLNYGFVTYTVRLARSIWSRKLEHNYNRYSVEFKKEVIDRVLIYHESANEVSLDLGMPNHGTLLRWIKEYKENG